VQGQVNWKEKREKKKNAQKRQETGEPAEHYEINQFNIGSAKFDEYYTKQFKGILDEAEFKQFVDTLYEKLPVTFRVQTANVNFEKVCDMLRDPNFIKDFTEKEATVEDGQEEEKKDEVAEESKDATGEDGKVVDMKTKSLIETYGGNIREFKIDLEKLSMDCKPFYPHNSLFEMMIPRELLKKNAGLKQIHQLVIEMGDSGLITRQEIVSMMPPILLDVHADHAVLDMCAAPGSKTSQLLELIQASSMIDSKTPNSCQPKGFVVANDADAKRAYMLTHQMNRLNTANIVITNHQA